MKKVEWVMNHILNTKRFPSRLDFTKTVITSSMSQPQLRKCLTPRSLNCYTHQSIQIKVIKSKKDQIIFSPIHLTHPELFQIINKRMEPLSNNHMVEVDLSNKFNQPRKELFQISCRQVVDRIMEVLWLKDQAWWK